MKLLEKCLDMISVIRNINGGIIWNNPRKSNPAAA
jgi:hypothetical protein